MFETLWLAGMVFANLWGGSNGGVTVPDGGSVESGVRVLTDKRTEYGPPILLRVPYVNRLFRTVGYARDAGDFQRIGVDFENAIDQRLLAALPVKIENAPCHAAPTDEEILRAMPKVTRGIPYIYEEFRDDIEITKEKLIDRVDAPGWFPLIGPAQFHHTQWKCTVRFTETIDATFPVQFQIKKRRAEVVYIDKDRIELCTQPTIDNSRPLGAQPSCPAGCVGGSSVKPIRAQGGISVNPPTAGLYDTAGYPKQAFDKMDDPGLKIMDLRSSQAHQVAAPDILRIDAGRLTPKTPYKLEPLEVLVVECANAKSRMLFVITPQGTIDLGQPFGKISVAGLTLDDAQRRIQEQMSRTLDRAMCVQVQLENARGLQQIKGEHLVRPDGTIRLGAYGSVHVQGMTQAQVKGAVEKHLSQYFVEPKVVVDVVAYNSRKIYIVAETTEGQRVTVLPATGNESVLDALAQWKELPANPPHKIWVSRPASGKGAATILPVDWLILTQASGGSRSNHQLLPGDRVHVVAAPPVVQAGHADPKPAATSSAATMTLHDVVRMSQKGISPRIIIRQMEVTGFVFRLTVDDIIMLHDAGVSEDVIGMMQDSPGRSRGIVPASRKALERP